MGRVDRRGVAHPAATRVRPDPRTAQVAEAIFWAANAAAMPAFCV